MKFLLFFVSLIFSFILYIFYSLEKGRDIFLNKISNSYDFTSFIPNLLLESFLYLFIGIIFLYIFSDFKEKQTSKLTNYKTEIIYFSFYSLFVFSIFFLNKGFNNFILFIVIIFIISDMLFNHVSNISDFSKNKLKIRYFGLILNYISSILIITYIFFNNFDFLLFLILTFNIIFNILIHKKFINYISLIFSILSIIFLIYNLYLFIFELYIRYI